MASISNCKSLSKASEGQRVRKISKQRLGVGLPSAQGIETQGSLIEIDLTADQAVRPPAIDQEGVTQQVDLSLLAGAPQKDNAAAGMRLKIEVPPFGKESAGGSRLDAHRPIFSTSRHIPGRLGWEGLQRLGVKAGPDLGLPATVEALDRSLKSSLTGWSQDGHDLQAEA